MFCKMNLLRAAYRTELSDRVGKAAVCHARMRVRAGLKCQD